MTDRLTVRAVQISDAERLAEIYSYYVNDTAVSFEYEAPSTDEFAKRIEHTTEKYPYLVCEKDNLAVGYLMNISAVRNWKRVPLREVGTVYSN